MLVHRKKRPPYGVQMPLTSLIDIVFLLLVYFLLTTNFMANEGIDVKLPHAKASSPQPLQEIAVSVDAQGRAFLENRDLALNELFQRLHDMISVSPYGLVVIKADRSVVLDKVVAVMDTAKAAGAARLVLATVRVS